MTPPRKAPLPPGWLAVVSTPKVAGMLGMTVRAFEMFIARGFTPQYSRGDGASRRYGWTAIDVAACLAARALMKGLRVEPVRALVAELHTWPKDRLHDVLVVLGADGKTFALRDGAERGITCAPGERVYALAVALYHFRELTSGRLVVASPPVSRGFAPAMELHPTQEEFAFKARAAA